MPSNAAKLSGSSSSPTTAVQYGAQKMRRATSLTCYSVTAASRSMISS